MAPADLSVIVHLASEEQLERILTAFNVARRAPDLFLGAARSPAVRDAEAVFATRAVGVGEQARTCTGRSDPSNSSTPQRPHSAGSGPRRREGGRR